MNPGGNTGYKTYGVCYATSKDGIRWTEPLVTTRTWGDFYTAFYNPFRRVWVAASRIHDHIRPELYSLSCAPYESLMLGLFAIWTGPSNQHVHKEGGQKRNDILLGFSRDGFASMQAGKMDGTLTTRPIKWQYPG